MHDSKLQITNNLCWLTKYWSRGKKSHGMHLFYAKQCYRLIMGGPAEFSLCMLKIVIVMIRTKAYMPVRL